MPTFYVASGGEIQPFEGVKIAVKGGHRRGQGAGLCDLHQGRLFEEPERCIVWLGS